MSKKYIVVLRSSGIYSNNELEKTLKNNFYSIKTFSIFKVEPIHCKSINQLTTHGSVLTTSSNAIHILISNIKK